MAKSSKSKRGQSARKTKVRASKKKSSASKRKTASKSRTKSSSVRKKSTSRRASASKKKSSSRKVASRSKKTTSRGKQAKKKTKRKPNAAFMKPLTPSSALAKVVGSKPIPRTKVVQKLWGYIKKNNLQDSANKRNINADANLRAVFGKNTVSMFEMAKIVSQHLK